MGMARADSTIETISSSLTWTSCVGFHRVRHSLLAHRRRAASADVRTLSTLALDQRLVDRDGDEPGHIATVRRHLFDKA